MKEYDIIIIGSGSGGYMAAVRAAQLGMQVAVIEKGLLGGVCVNWGCIPTKALVKSAQSYRNALDANKYGITIEGKISANFTDVIKRSRTISKNMSKGISFLFKKYKIDLINGHGKLWPNHEVEVIENNKATHYKGKHIIIATGARSKEFPKLKIDGTKVIGYKEALTLESLPKSLCVIGSGAIGSELSYIYNTFGTQVTLIESQDTIIPLEDADVSKQLQRSFKKNGIKVLTKASVESIDTSGEECITHIRTEKGLEEIKSEKVLLAVGVKRNIEHIGLEEVGIETNEDRILVDSFYRTNIPGYYAIGDSVKGQALAHVASTEGKICVEEIAGKFPERLDYSNIPSCIYCNLETASIGMTEREAKEQKLDYQVGMYPYAASGKANTAGNKEGFIKLIFSKRSKKECLGAHMVGLNVSEFIGEIAMARKMGASAHNILNTVHPHPTMSEAINDAVASIEVFTKI